MSSIGGQAIIEGVMIRNEDIIATAVRTPEGKIKTKKEKIKSWAKKYRKVFFIRGIINLVESLTIGIKELNYSANIAAGQTSEKEKPISTTTLIITLLVAFAATLFIFKFIPLLAAQYFSKHVSDNNYLFNIVDGVVKAGIFLGYLLAMSRMKDVRRVFQYHGAEHKAVNCHEHGEKVNLENCKKYSTIHLRCGTSFLITVLIISIIVYIFIPKELTFWQKLTWRILLLPVIAGIGYEIIKLGSKYEKSTFSKIITSPGRLIQKITTKEPDEKQLEVAIAAVKEATT
ncbi:MAG: DUF1385 domain-containing protein [archaeon]